MWLANTLVVLATAIPFASAAPGKFAEKLEKRQSSSLAYSPPSYPSPWCTGAGNWSAAYEKARAFVSQLTLLEKVNLTTGVGLVSHFPPATAEVTLS